MSTVYCPASLAYADILDMFRAMAMMRNMARYYRVDFGDFALCLFLVMLPTISPSSPWWSPRWHIHENVLQTDT